MGPLLGLCEGGYSAKMWLKEWCCSNESDVFIMMPYIGRRHDMSLKMAQNAVLLVENTMRKYWFDFSKKTLQRDQCDAALLFHCEWDF